MTDSNLTTGSICWTDLTVTNAESLRDFYKEVVGWESVPVEMGAYHDFGMKPVESD